MGCRILLLIQSFLNFGARGQYPKLPLKQINDYLDLHLLCIQEGFLVDIGKIINGIWDTFAKIQSILGI